MIPLYEPSSLILPVTQLADYYRTRAAERESPRESSRTTVVEGTQANQGRRWNATKQPDRTRGTSEGEVISRPNQRLQRSWTLTNQGRSDCRS